MTLFAYATDVDNHRVLLGQRTITLDNDHGAKPFGGIDTPSQGGTVSGVVHEFRVGADAGDGEDSDQRVDDHGSRRRRGAGDGWTTTIAGRRLGEDRPPARAATTSRRCSRR